MISIANVCEVNTLPDFYLTAAKEATVELKIERSRFIGHVRPVSDEDEAKTFIADISEEHRRATHNCWAYRVDPLNDTRFSSDDGEPTGTAGEPILRSILSQDLIDVAIVVTRYYGGRKLGIRGLIEAYGTTAGQALLAAGHKTKMISYTVNIDVAYPQLERCLFLIRQFQGDVVETDYQDTVKIKVNIGRSRTDEFCREIQNWATLEAPSCP